MLHYFEQYYSHDSYQSYLDSLEEIWLTGGTWSSATDPDNLDFFDDEITNTFFNSHGMLLIGTSLLVIDYNGDLWVIQPADCNTIANTSQDPSILANNGKATKLFGSSGTYTECPDYVKRIEYSTYPSDPNRKMKMKLKYAASHFGGDGTNMKSKIKTYKKKNSKWKHTRRELYTEVQANCTTDCMNFFPQNAPKGPKKRRSLKAKYENAGFYYYYQALHLVGTYKDLSSSVTNTIVQ